MFDKSSIFLNITAFVHSPSFGPTNMARGGAVSILCIHRYIICISISVCVCVSLSLYVYIYIYIHMQVYLYMYVHTHAQREIHGERDICIHTYVYVYLYTMSSHIHAMLSPRSSQESAAGVHLEALVGPAWRPSARWSPSGGPRSSTSPCEAPPLSCAFLGCNGHFLTGLMNKPRC